MTSRVRKTKMSWDFVKTRSQLVKSINDALRWMQEAITKALTEPTDRQQRSEVIDKAINKVMTEAMVEGVIQKQETKVFMTTRQKFRYRRNMRKCRMFIPVLTFKQI